MTTQAEIQAKPLLALGQTVATRGALAAMQQLEVSPLALLSRHQRGDWGNLDKEDKQANEQALTCGDRVFSSYQVTEAVKFWVITEADRSTTTILLPEEY
ncbi:MAG: hypothetical protein ACXWT1_10070 [Methylobacter sp.]